MTQPFDIHLIVTDVASGLAYVCAMCTKWRRAADRGDSQCEAVAAGKSCGGPLSGMTFPEYEGPLESAMMSRFCFRCGQKSTAGVRLNGGSRILGLCEKHVDMLNEYVAPDGRSPVVKHHSDDVVLLGD